MSSTGAEEQCAAGAHTEEEEVWAGAQEEEVWAGARETGRERRDGIGFPEVLVVGAGAPEERGGRGRRPSPQDKEEE